MSPHFDAGTFRSDADKVTDYPINPRI